VKLETQNDKEGSNTESATITFPVVKIHHLSIEPFLSINVEKVRKGDK